MVDKFGVSANVKLTAVKMSEASSNKNKKPNNKGNKQPQKKEDKSNKGDQKPTQKSQKKVDKNPEKNQNKNVKPENTYPKKHQNVPQYPIESISNSNPIDSTRGKYSKRKLVSNWTKLELPENIYDITEENQQQSTVEEIFKKPIALGGHFQFKHEKSWNLVEKTVEDNDLFRLNFKKITEHLLCIPFHERNDLDLSIFDDSQIEVMEQAANNSKSKYGIQHYEETKFFKNLQINSEHLDVPTKELGNLILKSESLADFSVPANEPNVAEDDDELDRILNLTGPVKIGLNISNPVNETSNKIPLAQDDNLEDWLDEYL